jgi:hypothetical protein
MDSPVYGWVLYVEGSNDDYICAWSNSAADLTVSEDVRDWQYILPAKEALEKLNYENPTIADLIEQLF